jgi:cyanocobalamin reductase (cyanide-eliminating) / alkylcobalamin dealkylase
MDIAEQVAGACAPAGFDLVQPFRLDWYNDAIAATYRLPDLGRARALGLLIGHSRALWAPFVAAVRRDATLRDDANPLERYSVDVVRAALQPLEPAWEARWSHEAEPRRVAMQRLGHLSGLAHLAECFLNVHPRYGPWIALRAAVVIDVDGPPGPAPDPANPCADCAHACLPAFERAAAASRARDLAAGGLGDTWQLWLAVRDACPLGRAYRYSEAQIAYHYRLDRSALRR